MLASSITNIWKRRTVAKFNTREIAEWRWGGGGGRGQVLFSWNRNGKGGKKSLCHYYWHTLWCTLFLFPVRYKSGSWYNEQPLLARNLCQHSWIVHVEFLGTIWLMKTKTCTPKGNPSASFIVNAKQYTAFILMHLLLCVCCTAPLSSIQCLFKGTVSREFLLLFFFMNQFPPSPWLYTIRAVRNFFENSWRYLQVKVQANGKNLQSEIFFYYFFWTRLDSIVSIQKFFFSSSFSAVSSLIIVPIVCRQYRWHRWQTLEK